MAECEECDGTGEVCATCGFASNKCICDVGESAFEDCIDCDGTGNDDEEDEDGDIES